MPIRETDLGHTYAEITVRPLAGSSKSWKGQVLADTGATDTFLPASVLRKLGIKLLERRSYELADGTEQELPIGFGIVEVLFSPHLPPQKRSPEQAAHVMRVIEPQRDRVGAGL